MVARAAPFILASALLTLPLGGCVAALVPVLAGGLVARKQIGGEGQATPAQAPRARDERTASTEINTERRETVAERAPQPTPAEPAPPTPDVSPEPVPSAALLPEPTPPTPLPAPPASPEPAPPIREASSQVSPPRETAPPSPIPPSPIPPSPIPLSSAQAGGSPYAAFVDYAMRRAREDTVGGAERSRLSMLVDQATVYSTPQLLACEAQPPAVVLDLDPGDKPFDLANPPLSAPGLAAQLASLRAAGVTVLWSANLPVDDADKLYIVLSATGLDPARTDRLLLIRRADETKQTRRLAAARDWCVVAIAGDRRADFDELFAYLRDPNGPVAAALTPNLGAGWFIAPPPID